MTNPDQPSAPPTLTLVEKLYARSMVFTEEMRIRNKSHSLSVSTNSSAPQVLLTETPHRVQDTRTNKEHDNRTIHDSYRSAGGIDLAAPSHQPQQISPEAANKFYLFFPAQTTFFLPPNLGLSTISIPCTPIGFNNSSNTSSNTGQETVLPTAFNTIDIYRDPANGKLAYGAYGHNADEQLLIATRLAFCGEWQSTQIVCSSDGCSRMPFCKDRYLETVYIHLPLPMLLGLVFSTVDVTHHFLFTDRAASLLPFMRIFLWTDLGSALNYFLGVSVTRTPSGMFLSQQKYATEVCLFMYDAREPHLSALKRILRYVRGTLTSGLQLYSSTTSSLVAYSDADWAGCPTTRRSTSGYCVFLGNNLLSWSSKRQFTLSRSSAEAEYRGVANAVAETCWLRNLLRELHTPLSTATIVYCDNVSAVYLSSNPVQHQRTKHIEIDIHFVRDLVTTGHIRVLHVPSRYQYADIFTKGLPTALFDEFRDSLSVRSSPAQTAGGC
ncbi:ribonuclease H-like domain-containing protein [Tanacetum coccineum]